MRTERNYICLPRILSIGSITIVLSNIAPTICYEWAYLRGRWLNRQTYMYTYIPTGRQADGDMDSEMAKQIDVVYTDR